MQVVSPSASGLKETGDELWLDKTFGDEMLYVISLYHRRWAEKGNQAESQLLVLGSAVMLEGCDTGNEAPKALLSYHYIWNYLCKEGCKNA